MKFGIVASMALLGIVTGTALADEYQPCSLRKEVRKADQAELYILSNQFVSLTINAQNGAGVEDIEYKPTGVKLVAPYPPYLSFQDRIYRNFPEKDQIIEETESLRYPYSAQVLSDTPETVSVKFSCQGRSTAFQWLTVSRTFTLKKDSSAIYVEHLLENGSNGPQKAGMWVGTFIRATGIFSERNLFIDATPEGVRGIPQPGKDAVGQGNFFLHPPLNWKAVLGKGSRTGMVAIVEYPYLSCFYNWYRESGFASTFEWIMRQQLIAPTGKFSTHYVLMPVGEFKWIDNVIADSIVCGIALSKPMLKPGDDVQVTVALASLSPQAVSTKVRLFTGETPTDLPALSKDLSLAPGATAIAETEIKLPAGENPVKIEVRVFKGDTLLGSAVRPLEIGKVAASAPISPMSAPPIGEDCVYPLKHLNLPGGEKLVSRDAKDTTAKGVGPATAQEEAPLSPKEKTRRATLKMYPALDFMCRISEEVVTPHVAWDKPSVQGKIRALFMVSMAQFPEVNTDKREVVEFAQRMDLDYGFLPLLKRVTEYPNLWAKSFAPDLDPYALLLFKEELAKNYSVHVVQGLDFNGVQPEFADQLIQEVKNGKGSVLINCSSLPKEIQDALGAWKGGVPANFSCAPEIDGGAPLKARMAGLCQLGQLGTGRLAAIRSADKRDQPWVPVECKNESCPDVYGKEISYWEYAMLLPMKAIAWASGARPAATVDSLVWEPDGLKAQVADTDLKAAVLEVTFKDEYNQTDLTKKYALTLEPGANDPALALPKMRGGFHLAEYRLTDNHGRVCDFGAVAFRTPTDCDIRDVTFNKRYYQTGEPVKAIVRLDHPPAGATLVAEVEDTYNRRMCRIEQGLNAGQDEALLTLTVDRPLATLHRLFVTVAKGQDVLVQKMAEFSFPYNYPGVDDLLAYMWYGQPRGFKRMHDLGFDGIIAGADSGALSSGILKALCSMNVRPFGTGTGGVQLEPQGATITYGNKLVRDPCFSNPAVLQSVSDGIRRDMAAGDVTWYGTRDFLLCDELYMGSAVCFCEHCMARFRDYLKGQYGTLEALNKEWGTAFTKWDDVRPLSVLQFGEDKDNMMSWLDHRMFMNLVFTHWLDVSKEAYRSANPYAKVGLTGTGNPDTTYNWWEMLKVTDFLGNYGGMQNDLINSFQQPGARTGHCTGGYVPTWENAEQYERGAVWYGLFNGNTAYFYWHGAIKGYNLLGDLTISNNMRYVAEELAEVKSGTAKLLFSAHRLDDGVALLYSQNSMFAAMGSIGKEFWDSSTDSWACLLGDMGITFKFISYEQLARTGVDGSRIKVLILPLSLSLSNAEIQNIRKFVEAGGSVIADYAPGLYDEHGKRVANDGLLQVFGIKRQNTDIRTLACRMSVKEDAENALRARTCTIRYAEEGVIPTTAKVFGDSGNPKAPALLVNRLGRGKAVLLNCVIGDYAQVTLGGTGGETTSLGRGNAAITTPIRELVGDVLKGAGVQPQVRLTNADGADLQPLTTTVRYRDGAAEYVGIMRGSSGEDEVAASDYVPVRVAFTASGHLYDVRERKYLGEGSSLNASMAPSMAKLYAILPYKVLRLNVEANNSYKAGETAVIGLKLETSAGTAGSHVIRVEVFDPDNRRRDCYSQNIRLEGGRGEVRIPLALNDPKGKWEVRVRDVATGTEGSDRFTLK